jgi:hypothetical protein
MDKKQKILTSLLGTAVILGISQTSVSSAFAGEGSCGNCGGKKGAKSSQTEANCGSKMKGEGNCGSKMKGEESCGSKMKKGEKEMSCGNCGAKKETKKKAKEKAKEMACAGPGGCGAKK